MKSGTGNGDDAFPVDDRYLAAVRVQQLARENKERRAEAVKDARQKAVGNVIKLPTSINL